MLDSVVIQSGLVYGQSRKGRTDMGDHVFNPFVEQYQSLSTQLSIAIREDDQSAIAELDRQLVSVFDDILQHQPSSKSELIVVCKFLVGELPKYEDVSLKKERICERLIELISEFVPEKTKETQNI